MTTLFFNTGRKHLVTTAEIVGKIVGVTRLPAGAVRRHRHPPEACPGRRGQ